MGKVFSRDRGVAALPQGELGDQLAAESMSVPNITSSDSRDLSANPAGDTSINSSNLTPLGSSSTPASIISNQANLDSSQANPTDLRHIDNPAISTSDNILSSSADTPSSSQIDSSSSTLNCSVSNATIDTCRVKCDQKTQSYYISMIKSRWKHIIVIVTLCLLGIFGVSHLQKSRNASPSGPLFKSPKIVDYANGDLTGLLLKIPGHEVSIVMYYAPWDLDSIRFAKQYEKLANFYKGQIFFAAINCWWPDGTCAKVMRLKRFPIFLAHIRDVGHIEYRGPLILPHLMSFLDNLLDPVVPLHHPGDLLELRSRHDAVLVRYCDFRTTSQPVSYTKLLSASIRALSFDPWRRLQFAVVNSRKLASQLHVSRVNSIYLFLWNGTFEKTFDESSDFDENTFKWIYETINHRGSLVEWVTSSGIKSNVMSNILTQRTTLILFTPRAFLHDTIPYYEMLREIAMDYYACEKSPAKSLQHRSILRRHLMKEKLLELEEWCHEKKHRAKSVSTATGSTDSCCYADAVNWFHERRKLDKKCLCKVCAHVNMAKYPSAGHKLDCQVKAKAFLRRELQESIDQSIDFCEQINGHREPKYTPYISFDYACTGNFSMATNSKAFASVYTSSSLDTRHEREDVKESPVKDAGLNGFARKSLEVDHETASLYSNLNLLDLPLFNSTVTDDHIRRMVQSLQDQHCSKLDLGLSYSDFVFPSEGKLEASSSSSFSISSSESPTPAIISKEGAEKQVTVDHLKSIRVNPLIGLPCRTNKTLKFIAIDSTLYPAVAESMGIDIENETHHTALVISDKTTDSLYLLNLHTARLNGYTAAKTLDKHIISDFIVNYTAGTLPKFLRSQEGAIMSSEACLSMTSENILCVPELTSRTFESIVSDNSKDVVVFYYTSWCGFCASISHIYLTVANFFRGIRGVAFTRINVDTNELATPFAADRIPTIALFPAKRKSDSLSFPSNMPITTTSLVQFIIANSQASVKWQTSFQLCDASCLLRNLHSYSSQLRKLYRSIKVTKDSIRRLQVSLFWPNTFRHSKHQMEQESYMKHLNTRLVSLNLARKSLNNLTELLLRRISRFTLVGKNDLTHDLLTDMLMLIKSPRQEMRDRRKDRKRKKVSKNGQRKKDKASLVKDEL